MVEIIQVDSEFRMSGEDFPIFGLSSTGERGHWKTDGSYMYGGKLHISDIIKQVEETVKTEYTDGHYKRDDAGTY